jgi:hypothetical protein
LVVYAGEDAALRPTPADRSGPNFAPHYKKVFANSYTEMTLLALADTMMQIKAIGDAGFPNFNDFVPGFADGLHPYCATGNIRPLAFQLQLGILRSLQVASWYQSGWDLSPDGVLHDAPPGWTNGPPGHGGTELVKYLCSGESALPLVDTGNKISIFTNFSMEADSKN